MKKILVLCILFLCSSWPIFAADSDYVCVHHENIDLNLTRELEKYLDLHFTKDFGHLPVAIVDATHIGFKDSNVYAFYNPKDNYIYFRDKDIVNKLNDKYTLNSAIHELTHFYQNNYGNKLPAGGTPNAIALLMMKSYDSEIKNFEIRSISKWEEVFKTTCNNINKFRKSDIVEGAKVWLNKFSSLDEAWNDFLRGCIAEGCACTMAVKNSSTWETGEGFTTLDLHYIYVFIPVFITYMKEKGFEGNWENYFAQFSNISITFPKWWMLISWNPDKITKTNMAKFTKDLLSSLANITNKQILEGIEKEIEKEK